MSTNISVSDSDCVKAAQAVEQLDRELDELMKVLAELDEPDTKSPAATTVTNSQQSTLSKVDLDPLVAWLDGEDTTSLPSNFSNLLTKPVEQSWLDERAMSSFDYAAARAQWGGSHPSSAITISSDGSSALPITISDCSSTSDRAVGRAQSPILMATSFKTPERPTKPASTQAPKAVRKPRKASGHHYSRWSMSHLQEEYLRRFQPLSQKRTLDRLFMIDALVHYDSQQASKSSTTSMSSATSTKKQRHN
jgi:hypothetical protein